MLRREFIKTVAGAAAAVTIPVTAEEMYGNPGTIIDGVFWEHRITANDYEAQYAISTTAKLHGRLYRDQFRVDYRVCEGMTKDEVLDKHIPMIREFLEERLMGVGHG